MTESPNIPDHSSSKPSHTNPPKSSSKKPTYKEHYGQKDPKNSSGKTHRFGCLVFNEKQWKKFMKQLEQSISLEIKRQQKRIKKAQEQLKKSIKGEPF